MITTDQGPNRVDVMVFGEFTLADYKEFEEVVNFKVQFEGVVNLLMDLRQMVGFTVDVAWEEIKFSRQHAHDFGRIAVLTTDQWATWSAWLSQFFVDAEVQVFEDEAEARAWLDEEVEATG
jgi:stage II sporulation SpoAA-like protein